MPGDPLTLIGVSISIIAAFAALGGVVARVKRRSPLEGVLLGLFLGPIGLLIEIRSPFVHRPIVDEKSVSSLQSMLAYQETGREFSRESKRQKNRTA
jgi:hypothetical protein